MPRCTCKHDADKHIDEYDERFPCTIENCLCEDYEPWLVEPAP